MNCKPKLRFPEFSDEWNSERVDKLFSHVRNGFVGTATPYYVEKGVPYLQSNNIRRNKIDKRKLVYINEEFHKKNKKSVLKKGDILMVQSGHAGECAVVPEEFNNANCHALVVMTPTKQVNPDFCAYYMNSSIGKKRIHKLITGQTINHILASDLKKYRINIPTLTEQSKIASFLSKVDSKIDLLEKKQELWETYKKGIVQQIFSQKLRFKDENGEDYPDWKDKKFSEILIEHKTKSTGNEEVFSVSVHKGLINQVEHLGRTFAAPDTSKYNLVKPGDIVYTKSPTGDFPLGIIKQSKLDKNVIVSPLYGVFSPLNKDLGLILDSYFESPINTKNYLHPIVQKGAKNTMNITNNTFLSRSLILPIHDKEQSKIANFLSTIDIIIEITFQELEGVEHFKKGLLQQMFC
ncbi:MAG: restriction endonuclease subunit S [Methanobacterium sp.]|uniref:restriction endonuclease subunit S n=1 Tax=Methanobacterium sp. TaxID=2164 RepID=UPI003D94CAE6